MGGYWRIAALLSLLACVLAACGDQGPIPPDGQELHVVVTETEVRLEPTVVRAGDVYVVMDIPGSSVGFVSRKQGDVEIGPVTDEDLARLARGDLEGFGIGGFQNGRSSTEGGDRMGPVGNVVKEILVPGKYAFVIWEPDGLTPRSIAVLEVLP